jgi:L-alanine-DL-glutamate epimerase-like enolase superfamily enzyme
MDISWKIFTLPLASTFTISKGTFTHRRALIVRLGQDGCTGLGEATEITYYGISIERFVKLIAENLSTLQQIKLSSPEEYHEAISMIFGHEPFLLCAFDCAAHDLYGQLVKKTTRELLQIDQKNQDLATSFTIGIGSIKEMIEKIKKTPWPIYKIKLGTPEDMKIMKALRQETDAILRVDANGGWTASETVKNSAILKDLGVEFIEQPMPIAAIDEMRKVRLKSHLPLIADESCQTEIDVGKCQGAFDGINIKLMKCGGLTVALRMIAEARKLNLKIMIGCMTETSIGISAAAQLIPLVDYVDLDGAMLIKEDVASGVSFVAGYPVFPEKYGLGCQLLNVENLAHLDEEK